jgi:phage shock protein A
MEQRPDDIRGMNAADAKEYIFLHINTLKLTEKKRESLKAECEKWNARVALARSKGAEDLALEAEKEAVRLQAQLDALDTEINELKSQIESMRKQVPGLAARERSIDPDLLEQELLISLGRIPGDDNAEPKTEAAFNELNADAALEALKAKMKAGPGEGPSA